MGDLFKGSTDVIDTAPGNVQGLRNGAINYLEGGAPGSSPIPAPPKPPPTADQLPGFLSDSQKAQMLAGMHTQYAQQMDDYNKQYGAAATGGSQPTGSSQPSGDSVPGGQNIPGMSGVVPYTGPQVNAAGMPSGGTSTVGNGGGPGAPSASGPSANGFNPMTGTMGAAPSTDSSPYGRVAGSTTLAAAPTNIPYAGNAAPVNYGVAAPVATPDRSAISNVTQNPAATSMLSTLMGNVTNGTTTGPQAVGSGASAGNFGPSVDQLGGANSPFFQNMMAQYQPAFTQARTDALAQAKESLGNLTGSSAGNALGTAMNRSLGDEQSTLSQLAQFGIGQQVGLDTASGQAGTQANIASANNATGASQTNAGIGAQNYSTGLSGIQNLLGLNQSGQIANQGADQNYLGLASQIGLGNMTNAQGAMTAGANSASAQSLQNQQLLQNALSGSVTNGMNMGQFNAGQSNAMSAGNAQNFLNMLLGLTNANNAGTAVQSNPSAFGQILNAGTQVAAAAAGKP